MKVQSNFTELGGKVYDLASKGSKNPLLDAKVISAIKGVKKLEAQIARLENISPKRKALVNQNQKENSCDRDNENNPPRRGEGDLQINICGNASCKLRKAGCVGFAGCPGFMSR